MKIIAYYAIYNEAEYIDYSLRSIYDYVDEIIIIEGSWLETYVANGNKRSNDGTIDIIKTFPDPFNKIKIYHHNEKSQLEQRNLIFKYLPKEDHLMLLIDGDEIYDKKSILEIKKIASNPPKSKVFRFKSLVFVNDFYSYYDVEYPRLYRIDNTSNCTGKPKNIYKFSAPNDITENGKPLDSQKVDMPEITFFHYSYCKSPERFLEKKRERIRLHGEFAWDLQNNIVKREGAPIRKFTGEHPDIMKEHPKFGKHIEILKEESEVIVYIEHSGIGNLVLSTPMLKAIRAIKPNAQIYVASWPRSARILEGAKFIDLIHTHHPDLLLNTIKRKIDHLIISPVGAGSAVVETLSKEAKNIHGINVGAIYGKHEAEYKMDFARKLGFKGPMPSCEIGLFQSNIDNADGFIKEKSIGKFVCVNAAFLKGEHWPMKHWGNNKFTKALIQIHNLYPDYHFVFVGSKEDRGDADRIFANMDPTRGQERDKFQDWHPEDGKEVEEFLGDVPEEKFINACGAFTDIKDCAALISKSVLSFGNDGGLQHIAAAVGVPTVTIFTFTNPIKNRPLSSKSLLAMKPCERRIRCQHGQWGECGTRGCLDVPVDIVLSKIKEILNEKK